MWVLVILATTAGSTNMAMTFSSLDQCRQQFGYAQHFYGGIWKAYCQNTQGDIVDLIPATSETK